MAHECEQMGNLKDCITLSERRRVVDRGREWAFFTIWKGLINHETYERYEISDYQDWSFLRILSCLPYGPAECSE
jgi:hypothetical protein